MVDDWQPRHAPSLTVFAELARPGSGRDRATENSG